MGCLIRLVLGRVATAKKSTEIAATPKLLEPRGLNGCIVSIDAMRCRTKIARQIVGQGADYVAAIKGNQGKTDEEGEDCFAMAFAVGFSGVAHHCAEETV